MEASGSQGANTAIARADEDLLASLGYKQEFKREFSGIETFGIAFSIIGLLPSIASVLFYSMPNGGPAAMVWGWAVASIFILFVGMSMGELASAAPTSGGLYFWTHSLSSPRWKNLLAWIVGYANTIGSVAAIASIDWGCAVQVMAAATIGSKDQSFAATNGQLFAVYVGIVFSHAVICCLGTKILARLQSLYVALNVLLCLAVIIALPAATPKEYRNTASFAFGNFTNLDGWPNGYAFIMSFLAPLWTICSFDSSVHISEEASNAAVAVPWAITGAIAIAGLLGWAINVSLAFCMGTDIEGIVGSSQPMAQIFFNSFGQKGALAIWAIIVVVQYMMGSSMVLAASRQSFAFSRDGALPFSGWLYRMNGYTGTPVNTVWFTCGFAVLLGLLVFAGEQAINAVFSLSVVALYIAYGIPIAARFLGTNTFTPGPFSLGAFSAPIAAISCLWMLFMGVVFLFPSTPHTGTAEMNYTVVVLFGTLILSVLWYYCPVYGGVHWFTGPVPTIKEESGSSAGSISDKKGNPTTLASPHALARLKHGTRLSFTHHTRSTRSLSSIASPRGFPCCVATAPSTLSLLSSDSTLESQSSVLASWPEPQKQDQDGTSSLVKRANAFLNPPSRFDWRPRAQSQVVHSLTAPPPATQAAPRFNAPATTQAAPRFKTLPRRVPPPHVDLDPGEAWYDEVQDYQKHFLPLLEYEQESSEAVVRERLSSWSLERLQREGYCLTNMDAYWLDGGSSNMGVGRFVASFMLGPGELLPPAHRFETGTQVLVTHLDPLRETPFRGSVISASETQLRVAFPEKFELDDGRGMWRLDVSSSAIAYQRMKAAVRSLHLDPARQIHTSAPHRAYSTTHGGARNSEVILQGTYLRDVLLRGFGQEEEDAGEEGKEGFFAPNAFMVSWARRYARPDPVVVPGDPDLRSKGLNETQIRAVAVMLGGMAGPSASSSSASTDSAVDADIDASSRGSAQQSTGETRMSLVLGPPGTGKTKTIIETVRLLKQHFSIPHPILLCTYTNVAVDHLVEGLIKQPSVQKPGRNVPRPIKPLRVGSLGKVRGDLEPHSLETQMAEHPRAGELEATRKSITYAAKRRKALHERIAVARHEHKHGQGVSSAHLENMEMSLLALEKQERMLKGKSYGIWWQILSEVVKGADVVCTTCITSASWALNAVDFPIVFIDEASMSTEPASLIPLMKGSQHVALIGDHKQLPPIITSPEAQDHGLGVSLFERLSEEAFLPTIMLDIQYRMHPEISRFPSHEFYNCALRDGTIDEQGNIAPGLTPPQSIVFPELQSSLLPSPSLSANVDIQKMGVMDGEGHRRPSVVFLDHVGSESLKDRSRVNWNEARIVCSLVEDLLLRNPTLKGSQIGVIAPYAAQISLLNRLLTLDAKYKERFTEVLGPRAHEMPKVEVKTVDGFEGREKDVIIFSTVRNNASGSIGFLADRRRLNVGLTRAKRGLFVVGSLSTLKIGKGRGQHQDAPEAMEDLRVAREEHSTPTKASSGAEPRKKKGTSKTAQGAEAWRRYATFLTDQRLVLRLEGDRLHRLLEGNKLAIKNMSGYPIQKLRIPR